MFVKLALQKSNIFPFVTFCSRQLLRRFSDEGLANLDNPGMRNFDGSSPISARRAHSSMSGHQRVSGMPLNPNYGAGHPPMGPSSRSWHPSPFASDDEIAANDEPQFYKVKEVIIKTTFIMCSILLIFTYK